ncbi:hypothetical protein SL1157_1559 [Ruegeria lacuscaerulensis ITI-1157]|nr:hypothetical protein SL1157_1559 [Ruegeria lacuscaerulensis ITI-1157]SHK01590.1 hypothetical protein SAMN05444404_3093 [Ruegeria lacuscaerulensis ITI-1157]
MADEFDARIAELNYKTALVHKETAEASARSNRSSNFLQHVIGGAIMAGFAAFASYLASTNTYKSAIREIELKYEKENREIDLELAKLSLTILAGEYEDNVENSLPARKFALNALERGTGVEIPEADKDTWARTGLTPGNIDSFAMGEISQIGKLSRALSNTSSVKEIGCVDRHGETHCGELWSGALVGDNACVIIEIEPGIVCGRLLSIKQYLEKRENQND